MLLQGKNSVLEELLVTCLELHAANGHEQCRIFSGVVVGVHGSLRTVQPRSVVNVVCGHDDRRMIDRCSERLSQCCSNEDMGEISDILGLCLRLKASPLRYMRVLRHARTPTKPIECR